MGPLLFNIFINDLAYAITNCNLATYADDTQIFFTDTNSDKIQETINTELTSIDQWYESNGMRRNHSKYQAMVMGNSQAKLQFYCENTTIPFSEYLNLLGITINN